MVGYHDSQSAEDLEALVSRLSSPDRLVLIWNPKTRKAASGGRKQSWNPGVRESTGFIPYINLGKDQAWIPLITNLHRVCTSTDISD